MNVKYYSIYCLRSCGWIVQNTAAQRTGFRERGKIKKRKKEKRRKVKESSYYPLVERK
jgi:hypothetical protein